MMFVVSGFAHIKIFPVFFVCIVPNGFDKNLQYRVQMRYEYKQSKKENGKYPDGKYLKPGNGYVGEEP